ncbi:MAG: hypothetical protein QOF03_1117 [Alphaproteobacteria bacterium]|nr:hypothetical protein [Alphaproteobacteria bacterium]
MAVRYPCATAGSRCGKRCSARAFANPVRQSRAANLPGPCRRQCSPHASRARVDIFVSGGKSAGPGEGHSRIIRIAASAIPILVRSDGERAAEFHDNCRARPHTAASSDDASGARALARRHEQNCGADASADREAIPRRRSNTARCSAHFGEECRVRAAADPAQQFSAADLSRGSSPAIFRAGVCRCGA